MRSLLVFFCVLLLLSSCGQDYDTQAEIDKIMAIHDEVMPKMSQVMKLKKQVLQMADESKDSLQVKKLHELAHILDQSNEGMMVWMRQWSKSANPHIEEKTDIELRKAFFAAQTEKVIQVRNDINSSIIKAESVLR